LKKLLSIAVLFLLLFTLTSCTKKLFIPLENNFKLTYKLSNPTPKLGDEIVKGHEKHIETKKLLVDKPGKYKITINSRFTINMNDSNNQGYAEYNLKTEPIEFEIK
jgi:hypothetical protein